MKHLCGSCSVLVQTEDVPPQDSKHLLPVLLALQRHTHPSAPNRLTLYSLLSHGRPLLAGMTHQGLTLALTVGFISEETLKGRKEGVSFVVTLFPPCFSLISRLPSSLTGGVAPV